MENNSIYIERSDIKLVGGVHVAALPTPINEELAIDIANDNAIFVDAIVNVSFVDGVLILSSSASREAFEDYVNEVESELAYMED